MALLDYHRDVAAFAVTKPNTVFVILDLEDREVKAELSESQALFSLKFSSQTTQKINQLR